MSAETWEIYNSSGSPSKMKKNLHLPPLETKGTLKYQDFQDAQVKKAVTMTKEMSAPDIGRRYGDIVCIIKAKGRQGAGRDNSPRDKTLEKSIGHTLKKAATNTRL